MRGFAEQTIEEQREDLLALHTTLGFVMGSLLVTLEARKLPSDVRRVLMAARDRIEAHDRDLKDRMKSRADRDLSVTPRRAPLGDAS